MPAIALFAAPDDSPRLHEADAIGLAETLPGPLAPDAQRQAWQALSRTPPAVVWVFWSSLTPPDLASLRRFRVSAPQTRIVIEVPESLVPPDTDLAQVLPLGIMDIVRSPSRSLADVLAHAGTYADVALWQGKVRSFDEPDPEPKEKIVTIEKIVERVIERETIKKIATTARPVLISVWSQQPGSGGTTLSMAIAAYLSGIAPSAVLDHAPELNANGFPEQGQTGLFALSGVMDEKSYPDLTVIPAISHGEKVAVPSVRDTLKSHEYAYIVLDAGLGPPSDDDGLAIWADSDLAILCIPPTFTRWQGIWPWIDRTTQARTRYQAVMLGSDRLPCERDDAELACAAIPWPGTPGHEGALADCLALVLPTDAGMVRRRRARVWAIQRLWPWAVGAVALTVLAFVFKGVI